MIARNFQTDKLPGPDPDELKHRIDFREFVAGDLGKSKRSGNALVGRSPLRPDTKPSFAAYKNVWIDFGTGERGDIFKYIMKRDGVDFPAALQIVRDYVGDPSARPIYTPQPTIRPAQTADWRTEAGAILEAAQRRLWNSPRILNYLRNIRGLIDETIKAQGLGYNPEWIKTAYIKPDGKPAWLAPGVVIPTFDEQGLLCGLRVRTHTGSLADYLGQPDDTNQDGKPMQKYLNLAGSHLSGWMMNADKVMPGCTVLMVEGEFDVMLASQILTGVVVVTLGSASNRLSDGQAAQLRTAGRVFVALDNDEAGQTATKALSEKLGNVTLLNLPIGKDVTEFVVEHGGDLAAWWAGSQRLSWHPNGVPDSWRSALLNYFSNSPYAAE